MKKFYTSIFAVVFLLCSFALKAQPPVTYNSILSNPGLAITLDDPAFWQGGVPPPNPCTNCTINVLTSVIVPHQGGSSYPPDNSGPWMNHVILNTSALKIQGAGTVVTINTWITLHSSVVAVGTDPVFNVSMILNDQVDMDAGSSVTLGNVNCSINANNVGGNTIQGTYDDFTNLGVPSAGIYSNLAAPVGGFNYSYVLNSSQIGYNQALPPPPYVFFPFYNINCGGPLGCNFGFINGPATASGSVVDPNFGVIFTPSSTLPVQLVKLLAVKNDDGSVNVDWSTSQEQNAGYYDVERSGDQAAWTKIGTVKAKGYSSTTTDYSFTDKLPLDGNGYYRLKMTDLDGKFKYSKTVSVTSANDGRALVVYSNPFSDMIRLKVNVSRAQELTMTVTDMLGKTYISQNYHAVSGDNMVNLPSSISNHGMYILRIHGESYDQTVKLQKQ